MKRFWKEIRNLFIAGLIVLIPIVLTVYILMSLFIWMDSFVGNFIRDYFNIKIPGLGILIILLIILLVGVIARSYVINKGISFGETILKKIPFARTIYFTARQLSEAFLKTDKAVFKGVVLVEFPRKGIYVVGFITNKNLDGTIINKTEPYEVLNIFVPTTPNPTSGFFLIVPKKDIIPINVSFEDALKLIVSGGTFIPEQFDLNQKKPSS